MEHRRNETKETNINRFSGDDENGTAQDSVAASATASTAAVAAAVASTYADDLDNINPSNCIQVAENVLPKVVELAQRLVPAAARQFEQGHDGQQVQGNISTTNEDLEGGLCLPRDVAMAAASLDFGESSTAADDFVPIGVIAASIDSDVALLDFEADALLESIRTSSVRNIQHNDSGYDDDKDNHSVTSFAATDDDGMGGEIRRLGQLVASLRRDLAGANGGLHIPLGNDEEGDYSDDHSIRTSTGRTTNYLAQQLQTWKCFGLQGDGSADSNRNAALIWAIALLWALIILLSSHVTFGSDLGGSEGWIDVLGSLFS